MHNKKLLRPRIDSSSSASIDPNKVVFNNSSQHVSDKEKAVVAVGLDVSISPRKIHFCNFLILFEILNRKIPNQSKSTNSGDNDYVKTKLNDIALSR